jgi:hypothetical protein
MPDNTANGESKEGYSTSELSSDQAAVLQQVERNAARKLRARGDRGVWACLD